MRTRILAGVLTLAVVAPLGILPAGALAQPSSSPNIQRLVIRAPGRRCTPTRCLFIHVAHHHLSARLKRCLLAFGFTAFSSIVGGIIGGAAPRGIAGGSAGASLQAALALR